MTKILYLKNVFTNNAIFSKLMSQSKDFFGLIQAPKITKLISSNGGATIKASRKITHDNFFFNFGTKRQFFPKKW